MSNSFIDNIKAMAGEAEPFEKINSSTGGYAVVGVDDQGTKFGVSFHPDKATMQPDPEQPAKKAYGLLVRFIISGPNCTDKEYVGLRRRGYGSGYIQMNKMFIPLMEGATTPKVLYEVLGEQGRIKQIYDWVHTFLEANKFKPVVDEKTFEKIILGDFYEMDLKRPKLCFELPPVAAELEDLFQEAPEPEHPAHDKQDNMPFPGDAPEDDEDLDDEDDEHQ